MLHDFNPQFNKYSNRNSPSHGKGIQVCLLLVLTIRFTADNAKPLNVPQGVISVFPFQLFVSFYNEVS